jgi:hypothetical protein
MAYREWQNSRFRCASPRFRTANRSHACAGLDSIAAGAAATAGQGRTRPGARAFPRWPEGCQRRPQGGSLAQARAGQVGARGHPAGQGTSERGRARRSGHDPGGRVSQVSGAARWRSPGAGRGATEPRSQGAKETGARINFGPRPWPLAQESPRGYGTEFAKYSAEGHVAGAITSG